MAFKLKMWLVFIGLLTQPMLFIGLLVIDGDIHFKMMNMVIQATRARELNIAVKATNEGAKSPLDAYGATNLTQLESWSNEAEIKSKESANELKNWAPIGFYTRLSILMLEFLFVITGVVLIGRLMRGNMAMTQLVGKNLSKDIAGT